MKGNFSKLINGERPVLVDFHAEWCGPCKMQAPILKELSEKIGDKIRIIKIDVDKNQSIAQRYQVRGVPTLILFKKGEIAWRESGVKSTQQLINIITPHTL